MMTQQTLDATVKVNGVDIAFQLYGDQKNPTIVLIHGLGAPLTAWPKAMVTQLVAQGFQVLLFDNRDMGKSELLNHLKMPNLVWLMLKLKLGLGIKAPYQLEDMMNDTIELLDQLGLEKVHIVGASMGGMISQLVAINHPHRLHSLTSIMSTTGNKTLPKMSEKVKQSFAAKPDSHSGEDILKFNVEKWQVIGSPDYPAEQGYLTEFVQGLLERGITGKGTLRQMLAVMASKNREQQLANISTPTLVLHGEADELIRVECGKATAAAIPNAKLKTYPGMGHDLPIELIPSIVQDITAHINEQVAKQITDHKEVS